LCILESLGISVKLPIIVRIDNIGAIFMAENASSGVCTRHIDTRYHLFESILKMVLFR
jgi:hypothetical protein